MSDTILNPEWGFVDTCAVAALVPHGRAVPLRECPPGPYLLDGNVAWMSEHGQESYNLAGEHCCIVMGTMVQPLQLILHTIPRGD